VRGLQHRVASAINTTLGEETLAQLVEADDGGS
jgi:hypothetical protein